MKKLMILLTAFSLIQVFIASFVINSTPMDVKAVSANQQRVETSMPVPIEISPRLKDLPVATEAEPIPVVVAPSLKDVADKPFLKNFK